MSAFGDAAMSTLACVRYDVGADDVVAGVVVVRSVWYGSAGSLMEIAHGPVVNVPDVWVAGWAPEAKGRLVDYLATAYAVDLV